MMADDLQPTGKNARLVLDILREVGRPLGAYDLLGRLSDSGVTAPTTIYRALDQLVRGGFAHRVESLNAFVACANGTHAPDRDVIGFAICGTCGSTTEFTDPDFYARLADWSDRSGFEVAQTVLEISGHCADCQGAR